MASSTRPPSALLEDVERILERLDAPDCIGQPEGTECWTELANQPGCHVWNERLQIEAVAKLYRRVFFGFRHRLRVP